jgi:hypothetical protein
VPDVLSGRPARRSGRGRTRLRSVHQAMHETGALAPAHHPPIQENQVSPSSFSRRQLFQAAGVTVAASAVGQETPSPGADQPLWERTSSTTDEGDHSLRISLIVGAVILGLICLTAVAIGLRSAAPSRRGQ